MLNLYILPTCPYCLKVINEMDKLKVKYKKIDISKDDKEEKLIEIGGKNQVPFLHNTKTNEKLYESDLIIEYLKK